MRRTVILSLLLSVGCATSGIAQSIPATRPPSSQVTLPGPQRHGPPAQPAPPPGTVEGFVYWDTVSISHTPASSCSGLSVTVAVGNSTGGKSTAYQSSATLSNNFKYVGQVKQFIAGGKIKTYEVCTYGYGHTQGKEDVRSSPAADWQMYSHFLEERVATAPEKLGPGKYKIYSIDTARWDSTERQLLGNFALGPGGFDKGDVWVTAKGCPVKFVLDEEMHKKDGSLLDKIHYEESMVKK